MPRLLLLLLLLLFCYPICVLPCVAPQQPFPMCVLLARCLYWRVARRLNYFNNKRYFSFEFMLLVYCLWSLKLIGIIVSLNGSRISISRVHHMVWSCQSALTQCSIGLIVISVQAQVSHYSIRLHFVAVIKSDSMKIENWPKARARTPRNWIQNEWIRCPVICARLKSQRYYHSIVLNSVKQSNPINLDFDGPFLRLTIFRSLN